MIQFTEIAVEKVKLFMEKAQPRMVLRIKPDPDQSTDNPKHEITYSFSLEPQEATADKDLHVTVQGFVVRMDAKTAIKLASRIVDWENKEGKEGFALKLATENPIHAADKKNQTPEELAISVLKTIYDPEIPVNIYDMGLIYDVKVIDAKTLNVLMTLTAPHCPAAESLPSEVQERLLEIPDIQTVDVELTWEPAWSPERMTEEARLDLGI